ncbi:F-box protein containing LRR [Moesziomyces antarcticus T-34]|uniref:F-box protein containing LRR n=1 Tax=Pseudozyma antarctica (strain T-34) TaxID=1151754 RepID=M9MCT5_PSEA3|nr:F-box protein containing LRR [Moesziomyces antarcticus T-34]
MDKGKQKARDPELPVDVAPPQTTAELNLPGCSRIPEAVDIPNRAATSASRHGTDHITRESPSSFSDMTGSPGRRPTHTRAKSSLGSSHMFDFFGPSSIASDATAATSFHFGSPGTSPKLASTLEAASPHIASQQRDSLEDTVETRPAQRSALQPASADAPEHASASEEERLGPQESALGAPSAAMLPLYPDEILPDYEEAPEYTPPLSQPSSSSNRSKTSAFRTAAANRFLSSRIAKKLNLPPALHSRLQGTQTPDAHSSSQHYPPFSSAAHSVNRAPFARSDSAPDLARTRHASSRTPIEVRSYAATAYMDGARMGPAPRRPRLASSRPSTAHTSPSRSQTPDANSARPATSAGTVPTRGQPTASPLLRTAVSSAVPSRRNSGETRPPSRATVSSAPNGGLFTCGYSATRSGATTPTRPGSARKARSRKVSLRSLGDLFSVNRERDLPTPALDQQEGRSRQNAPPATLLREVVSPVSSETLISARVHSSSLVRPALMTTTRSSAHASIDAAESGTPVLILPHQSRQDALHKLPREVVLTIFKSLVDLHVEEHQNAVQSGAWRGKQTSETRWVGAEAAVRELARLSRVSRTWQSYVLDGQLWQSLAFSDYPDMAEEAMISIANAVGPFVRRLDLHGHAGLRSSVLLALSKAQRARSSTGSELELGTSSSEMSAKTCQLEELDLEGCRQISTSALNIVLSRSPRLKICRLANLPCVDNTTLCTLAACAPKLEVLDVSRCANVDGEGIRAFFAIQESELNNSALLKERNVRSKFRELHAAGVAGFDSATLAQLGRHWPTLEVLDLSYCSDVNDAAVAALVSSEGDLVSEKGNFATLTPRQAGSQGDEEMARRSFPYLRRLNLSSCRALTDRACVSLSHAVPKLEVLELSNIGPALKDTGLVKLLATVPQLQKLDLERATQITDAVLSALTPPESHAEAFGLAVPDRDTLMNGVRPRGSLLHLARRSASRRRQANLSSAETQDDSPPGYSEEAVAALIPATGTRLTHLVLSSANRLTPEALLLLVNRCPFLVHLEVDDTHADNEVAMQFVQLARYRKVQNAYLCLVDCRSFSRDTYSHLNSADGADGGVRPRRGSRGYPFRHFFYDDAEPTGGCAAAHTNSSGASAAAAATSSHHREGIADGPSRASLDGRERDRGYDECNVAKPVVKSFWGWQLVDARMKQRRKADQRAAAHRRHGGRNKMGSVVAMALGLPVPGLIGADETTTTRHPSLLMGTLRGAGPRWTRMLATPERGSDDEAAAHPIQDDDDDTDDPRGCTVM